MYFIVVGLFYIERTNRLYYMTVTFANGATRLPNGSIEDIEILVDEINNNGSFPFDAICVDIDAVIDMGGNIVWVHEGKTTYNKNIELIDVNK